MLAMLEGIAASIPRTRTSLCIDLGTPVRISDFDDVTFKFKFRFRREHVAELLREFDLA